MTEVNGFAALRERLARLEGGLEDRSRRLEHIEEEIDQARREREENRQTARRFIVTTSLAAAGIVFTAASVIAALIGGLT